MTIALEFEFVLLLTFLVFGMAVLYSSVGHGGASGYLAAMALLGISVLDMKPAALVMNIAVAGLVVFRLARQGYFNWTLFWPFALSSVPLAYLGGSMDVSAFALKIVIGGSLLIAAIRLFTPQEEIRDPRPPPVWLGLLTGAGLGFTAGLTGVGGAIYLSPILYVMRWADMRTNAVISGAFVLVNSASGLAGYLSSGYAIPSFTPHLVTTALVGAFIGSALCLKRLHSAGIRRLLGVVLLVAGGKLILTA